MISGGNRWRLYVFINRFYQLGPLTWQYQQKATTLKRKAATRKFGTRLANRTKRVAAKSIAAISAESIPFIGVAVLIADAGYELYAACETVKDLGQLYSNLGMADETPEDVLHSVCDPALPDLYFD